MKKLTIIYSFRDRDIPRVKRCLDSLEIQIYKDFEVIFVDYGSQLDLANKIQELIESYGFCRYIYSDTRGWPWNRSKALNIGIKQAKSDWVMLSDIDLIYGREVIESIITHSKDNLSLHAACHYLPEKFNQWDSIEKHIDTYGPPCFNALGLVLCIKRSLLLEIRGFDEFYQFWGGEDTDIESRLNVLGIETQWLDISDIPIYHQWHPANNHLAIGFMPSSYWDKLLAYNADNEGDIIRNPSGWGEIIDLGSRKAVTNDNKQISFTVEFLVNSPENYASNNLYKNLAKTFNALQSGESIIINDIFLKPSKGVFNFIIFLNKILRKIGFEYSLVHNKNIVKDVFFLFLDNNSHYIDDFSYFDNSGQQTFLLIKK